MTYCVLEGFERKPATYYFGLNYSGLEQCRHYLGKDIQTVKRMLGTKEPDYWQFLHFNLRLDLKEMNKEYEFIAAQIRATEDM